MRRFRLALLGALALATAGLPLGQLKAQAPAGLPGIGAGSQFGPTIENYLVGGPALALSNLSGCITGGSPTLVGNQGGIAKVTGGTTAQTTCTITWPVAWKVAPICNISGETVGLPAQTVTSTTVLTWTFASTASTVWDVICFGRLN